MNELIVIAFVVALFVLSIGGLEGERTDSIYNAWVERTELRNEGLDFETGMKRIDSLWNVIQAIELLEDKYFILPKKDYEKRTIEMPEYGKEGYFKK